MNLKYPYAWINQCVVNLQTGIGWKKGRAWIMFLFMLAMLLPAGANAKGPIVSGPDRKGPIVEARGPIVEYKPIISRPISYKGPVVSVWDSFLVYLRNLSH